MSAPYSVTGVLRVISGEGKDNLHGWSCMKWWRVQVSEAKDGCTKMSISAEDVLCLSYRFKQQICTKYMHNGIKFCTFRKQPGWYIAFSGSKSLGGMQFKNFWTCTELYDSLSPCPHLQYAWIPKQDVRKLHANKYKLNHTPSWKSAIELSTRTNATYMLQDSKIVSYVPTVSTTITIYILPSDKRIEWLEHAVKMNESTLLHVYTDIPFSAERTRRPKCQHVVHKMK